MTTGVGDSDSQWGGGVIDRNNGSNGRGRAGDADTRRDAYAGRSCITGMTNTAGAEATEVPEPWRPSGG